jgi:hypothetical protein
MCVVPAAEAATCTWTGAAANANWNQAGNWSGCSVPAAGDDLMFPDGAARLTNTNNFAGTLALHSITFSGTTAGYVLQGNAISLSAGIASNNSSGTNRLALTITLVGSQTLAASTAGGTLLLQHQTNGTPVLQLSGYLLTFAGAGAITAAGTGSITNAGSLSVIGPGLTSLNAPNAGFTGIVTVNSGTLSIGDLLALGAADGTAATGAFVNSGATLNVAITGTVANKLLTLTGGDASTPATFSATVSNVIWSGPITFTGTADVRGCGSCAAGQTTLSGPITGSGTFRTGTCAPQKLDLAAMWAAFAG